MTQQISLPSGTPAYRATPSDGREPTRGVVVFPDIGGLRPLFSDLCQRLADEAREGRQSEQQHGRGRAAVARAPNCIDGGRRRAERSGSSRGSARIRQLGTDRR